ncbi:hypothetical protein BD310DRAFT_296609 [Dichomitus squalens]|uniref:RNI-like protein n=1 Tax=Dichomitus squalens TaxID=114155 RepID=A0A4Q9QCG7_9APHY|nr:hypothetical protein BD310DRAFT_296609 [Dichomitus squalens]
MGGRKRSSRNIGGPPAKRSKANASQADDDIPTFQSQSTAPSTSTFSIRDPHAADHLPSLTTICLRAFAGNMQKLSSDPETWEDVKYSLRELPDVLVQKVFAACRQICPTLLTHALIAPYFLRGSSVVLSSDLPGVNRSTLFAIGDMPSRDKLRELELTGFSKIADSVFASVVAKLPSLRKLNLRGCTKVGSDTAHSAANHCPQLEVVNFNYTAVPAMALAPLLQNCSHLEVLKVAGIVSWTDHACAKLWSVLRASGDFQLPNLRSLKLRQASVGDASVNPILAVCPNLRRLDLSFTPIKHPVLPSGKLLEKLVLTSTNVSGNELVSLVTGLPGLKVLSLGAMGGNEFTTATISQESGTTITDDILRAITDALEDCHALERVSLVWNTRIGFNAGPGPRAALAQFIRRVGRRCTHLNLSGILHLRPSHLEGLAPDGPEEGPPRLEYLNLNNTPVDDNAIPYLSACTNLKTLELAGTRVTKVGLLHLLDACKDLEKLDLTSCRGVRIGERRRFFEVWEEWKNEERRLH